MAQGVGHQVAQHLVQPAGISGQRQAWRAGHRQCKPCRLRQAAETGADIGQQLGYIHRLPRHGQLTSLGQRQGAQVLHQPPQAARLVQGGGHVLLRRFVNPVEDAFQVALDDVQRVAQLVRNVGGEVAALLICARQLRGHPVEGDSQPLEIGRPVLRHTHAQIARGDGVRGGHHVGQRRGDPSKGPHGQRHRQHR